jgi:hypothetical protein
LNKNYFDGYDVGSVARHVPIVDGSQSDEVRHVLRLLWKSKRHALFATRLERLQTAVEDVPLSELHRQVGIEIVVQQVVEYIRIFYLILSCCIT